MIVCILMTLWIPNIDSQRCRSLLRMAWVSISNIMSVCWRQWKSLCIQWTLWLPTIDSQRSTKDNMSVCWGQLEYTIAIAWMSLCAGWVLFYSILYPYTLDQFCPVTSSTTWTLALNRILLTLSVNTLYVSLLYLCCDFKIILQTIFLIFITHLSQ